MECVVLQHPTSVELVQGPCASAGATMRARTTSDERDLDGDRMVKARLIRDGSGEHVAEVHVAGQCLNMRASG